MVDVVVFAAVLGLVAWRSGVIHGGLSAGRLAPRRRGTSSGRRHPRRGLRARHDARAGSSSPCTPSGSSAACRHAADAARDRMAHLSYMLGCGPHRCAAGDGGVPGRWSCCAGPVANDAPPPGRGDRSRLLAYDGGVDRGRRQLLEPLHAPARRSRWRWRPECCSAGSRLGRSRRRACRPGSPRWPATLGATARVPAAGSGGRAVDQARSPSPATAWCSVLGDGVLVKSSGLPSPYRYLWSLPARTCSTTISPRARPRCSTDRTARRGWWSGAGPHPAGATPGAGDGPRPRTTSRSPTCAAARSTCATDLTRDVPSRGAVHLPLATWNQPARPPPWTSRKEPRSWQPPPDAHWSSSRRTTRRRTSRRLLSGLSGPRRMRTCWWSTTTARTAPATWSPRTRDFGRRVAPAATPGQGGSGGGLPGRVHVGARPRLRRVVQMDADLSHPPERRPCTARRRSTTADMAIGSRYVRGGARRELVVVAGG